MLDRRLLNTVEESKKYIAANIVLQWISLVVNICMMAVIVQLLMQVYNQSIEKLGVMLIVLVGCILVRYVCALGIAKMGYLSSKEVKRRLREMIFDKLLRLGSSYTEQVKTSEVVQVAVEGVDQLEIYFSAYIPQLVYALLAPITLFVVLSFIDFTTAMILLVCVPLIPVSIVMIQRWAKKLLSKYWGQYTALGDHFLENLQGLTTLKIYQTDEQMHQKMNEESEKFRKITMRVLTMQLNSISVMDLVAYGGAAVGMICAIVHFSQGMISLGGCLFIILLSADFFIPMRQLGSFFHIAMNGMAASDKIFALLALEEPSMGSKEFTNGSIQLNQVSFGYDENLVLQNVNMEIGKGQFVAMVGESGCGKSTFANLLMKRNRQYSGSITINGEELKDISEESLMRNVTYIGFESYLFKGTVRSLLLMGNKDATEQMMWNVLDKVNLKDFLLQEGGLDFVVLEKGSNLSKGQCQRLALARALLQDSDIYIFDEATSNIDMESEEDIMKEVHLLAKNKTVILISHRLFHVQHADCIYVMKNGKIVEVGTHEELLKKPLVYSNLWNTQQRLENLEMEVA